MWVIGANVLAKILGPILVDATSGSVKHLLSRRINILLTGDKLLPYVFEKQIFGNVNNRLWLELLSDLGFLADHCVLATIPVETDSFRKSYHPGYYWSGCPPDRF